MDRAKFSLSPLFQDKVLSALKALHPAEEKAEQNCRYRLDMNTKGFKTVVKQYTNGTFYVESSDAVLYAQILETVESITGSKAIAPKPTSKSSSSTKSSSEAAPGAIRGKIDIEVPYIGTDESGKGDYFGPLVIAGVYTTPQTAKVLEALGVMDSKMLKDGQMFGIAAEIQTVLGPTGFGIIEIGPKRYNELYDSFKKSGKNLNHLLAWGHAKAIESLLEKNPDCTHAIADQFGSEHYIQSQLQTLGKKIELLQTPKAEANIGVAAASILARVRFVQKMKSLGGKYGVNLPFGCSNQVLAAARLIIQNHGSETLKEVAKLHFKTTETLLARQ
jgi:ribonuclease HIII